MHYTTYFELIFNKCDVKSETTGHNITISEKNHILKINFTSNTSKNKAIKIKLRKIKTNQRFNELSSIILILFL